MPFNSTNSRVEYRTRKVQQGNKFRFVKLFRHEKELDSVTLSQALKLWPGWKTGHTLVFSA
nr:MAG TPA: hypothetical protein [Caudoviricetes sp.]